MRRRTSRRRRWVRPVLTRAAPGVRCQSDARPRTARERDAHGRGRGLGRRLGLPRTRSTSRAARRPRRPRRSRPAKRKRVADRPRPGGQGAGAIVQLSGLGRIVSQQVTIDDLQEGLDALERRQSSLRAQIARIGARLDTETLDAETRAVLEARRARLQGELARCAATSRPRASRPGCRRSSSPSSRPTPRRRPGTALAARPHARRGRERPRLGRGHRARARDRGRPIALLGVAAWLGQRLYRRREDERLLAQS